MLGILVVWIVSLIPFIYGEIAADARVNCALRAEDLTQAKCESNQCYWDANPEVCFIYIIHQ